MDKNPLEAQRKEIETLNNILKIRFSDLFDNPEDAERRIEEFISQLEFFANNGVVINKDKISKNLRESLTIKDKDLFINHILKTLEPLVFLKVTQSKKFGILERELILGHKENVKLSEVLYTNSEELNDETESVHIHLPFAKDFMNKTKIRDFELEVKKGLVELAKRIKFLPHKKRVWASSWIVAASPERLKELGFTIKGEISEEEKREHFIGEDRPIAEAFIDREDLLAKYGSSDLE